MKWPEQITVADLLRIKSQAEVDLMTYAAESESVESKFSAFVELETNPALFLEVLRLWAKPDSTPETFGAELDGAALKAGTDQFMQSLDRFFLDWKSDPTLGITWTKTKQLAETRKANVVRASAVTTRPISSQRLWREVWRNAGVAGVDPRPFTVWQLNEMAAGMQRAIADRIAPIECMMVNERIEEGTPRYHVAEFNPFRERDEYT